MSDSKITDKLTWKAYNVLVDEAKHWRIVDFNGRGVIATRDITTPEEMFDPAITPEAVAFERRDFADLKTATSYIEWRALKAALLAVERSIG